MKVICDYLLLLAEHIHTLDTVLRFASLLFSTYIYFVVFVVHGGMRAVSSSQKIIHTSPICPPPSIVPPLHTHTSPTLPPLRQRHFATPFATPHTFSSLSHTLLSLAHTLRSPSLSGCSVNAIKIHCLD